MIRSAKIIISMCKCQLAKVFTFLFANVGRGGCGAAICLPSTTGIEAGLAVAVRFNGCGSEYGRCFRFCAGFQMPADRLVGAQFKIFVQLAGGYQDWETGQLQLCFAAAHSRR